MRKDWERRRFSPRKMSRLRILIVEDEAVTAVDLHDELIAQGYEVTGTTGTAEDAHRLAAEDPPDLVLMDIQLAGSGDGILAASAMLHAEIPVIFLTAHYDARTLARAKRARPVGYITKPFEPHQLSVAIEMGIERHRSDTERMRLARQLAENQRQLHEHAAKLETTVAERTSELRAAVVALELEIIERLRLEREIMEVSEREQCRLGQDLHDGLGQELTGISFLGTALANGLEAQSHPSAKAAANIATYLLATINSARRLAKGLYPVELSRYGLLIALEELANRTSQRLGICCELRQNGEEPMWAKSAEIHIYRIVQECISNALKHGKAQRIAIESLAGEGVHTFTVTDDGLGFEKPEGSTGIGLHLMNYRARVIGAKLDVRKPAEGGCRVTCQMTTLPLPALS